MSLTEEQNDYQYAQERAWEDEQAYAASKSAEAQMEAEMEMEAQPNQPTKEQTQWLWEQCGFELRHLHLGTWLYPDGTYGEIPDIDSLEFLGFLFKYAVPKLLGEDNPSNNHRAYNILLAWLGRVIYNREDPAIALFWEI